MPLHPLSCKLRWQHPGSVAYRYASSASPIPHCNTFPETVLTKKETRPTSYTMGTHQIGSKSKEVGWYDNSVTEVDNSVRDLLENYSGYASDEVVPLVNETVSASHRPVIACTDSIQRDKIWDVFPWPCVGQFRFLDLSLSRHQRYPAILAAVKRGARFLDVGCCFAQDIRKMVHDGASGENLWGLDKQEEFIALAHDFFRDETRLSSRFIVGDLLDCKNEELLAAQGTFGIVQLGMILHTWDRQGQLDACRRIIELLSSEPGSLIIGQSVGHLDGIDSPGRGGKYIFKHNAETFRQMWNELGRETGTSWHVDASLDEGLGISQKNRAWDDPRTRRLVFSVVRLQQL